MRISVVWSNTVGSCPATVGSNPTSATKLGGQSQLG